MIIEFNLEQRQDMLFDIKILKHTVILKIMLKNAVSLEFDRWILKCWHLFKRTKETNNCWGHPTKIECRTPVHPAHRVSRIHSFKVIHKKRKYILIIYLYLYVYILVLFLTKTIVNLNNLIQDHCNSNTIAKKKLSKSFAYLFLVLYFIHKSFFIFLFLKVIQVITKVKPTMNRVQER